VIRDIADEIYRNKLERIFFHDLLNISTGIAQLLSLVNGNTENFKRYEKLLTELAEEMLEEIGSQRDLLGAEQGSVHVRWQTVNSLEIIDFVIELLTKKDVAKNKIMKVDESSESVNFKTDKRLIRRIIVNMVKNALEASEEGETVLLKSSSRDNKALIEVHNNACIPEDIRTQVFNRSFSTRGCGRGLGAYSMKILSENYLQGKIYFTSTPEEGTSFFAEYPLEPIIEAKHPDQEQF
jgi:signal transduction histidine kinase